MANSTVKARKSKPNKPYNEFPLFPHANGCWAKKIRGKLHYFGKRDDCDSGLQKFLDEKNELHVGRTPPGGWTLTTQGSVFGEQARWF